MTGLSRSFQFFLWTRLAGNAANQMLLVALGWQMYDLTSSAWDLGLVGLFQTASTGARCSRGAWYCSWRAAPREW